jgi:superfamily II DNA or RNA helicase/HKD family nuclease/SOS-response transcriptional repressor LexA
MSPFPTKHLTVGGDDPFLPSLLDAINHATEISITTAFIRMTGVRLIQSALVDALNRGATVRILTGDYLGITDPNALRYFMLLQEQGAQVKVFESQGKTSFHMKAYLFTRSLNGDIDEGCAFVGSSNISQAALLDGLEWNLRIDRDEDEPRFQAVLAEYDALYADARCKALSHQWIDEYIKRLPPPNLIPANEPGQEEVEPPPTPSPIQAEALAALAHTRDEGFRRGLVVMATGLGKTWLAAFDSQQVNAKRVLFVAHREEILQQAEETFVRIRPDVKVGRYNGKERDLNVDMLFASIQTLGRTRHLQAFGRDHFDYVVVDEFHHASARTYQQLLAHFNPRFLLGLTATPERTDQSDILGLCDDNLVFNRDLFDGIEAKLLCPFSYQGIADVIDYEEISWRNGKFDPEQLTNQLATRARAMHNFRHWQQHHQTRTLAFCISKKHADFMAEYFIGQGVKAASVHSDSTVLRNEALTQLRSGELDVVFSVDLFNEGVDLPSIDTVLMLRPTESKIIFLQQLGRGLRNSPNTNKDKLVVLDFIGNHISFFRKPEALFKVGMTNKARKDFIKEAKEEALSLPPGCFVNYDLKSIEFMEKLIETKVGQQEAIYRALRESYGRRPVLAEFYWAGGGVDAIRREHGQWFAFVKGEKNDAGESDFNEFEQRCLDTYEPFFHELETTQLTKSFKLILLEALIELDGFVNPPSTEALAIKSFEVLQRRRALLVDLPKQYTQLADLDTKAVKAWHKYWLGNPVNAWVGGNTRGAGAFFQVIEDTFYFNLSLDKSLQDTFAILVQELVNYRFLQYEARLATKGETLAPTRYNEDLQLIPYFSDLKIACGHFKTSPHETEQIEQQSLPFSYGTLDPAKHFIARASGNSMNGGTHPIKEGDYLLLELITPDSAGSNNGKTIAIEQQDVSGDDQYLLRNVQKKGEGQYQLNAQNPDYEPMMTTNEMNTFARLKQVINVNDILLHREFYKYEVSELFGIAYQEGVWKMHGHVCPKVSDDQFLFVNLNKQGALANQRFHDYFVDDSRFHWQSQNRTTPENEKGLGIIESNDRPGSIYLFVRKFNKIKGKGAPFTFCGRLKYLSHEGSAPMDVDFEMESPLSAGLYEFFQGK